MRIERLKRLNPKFHFYPIDDDIFKQYGRKLNVPSYHLIRYVYQSIPLMGCSFHYEPDYPELHHFTTFKKLKKEVFKGKDIQLGIVSGFNEYTEPTIEIQHTKCLIAFTDCVLVLKTNGKHPLCFLLKKADCIELYPGLSHSLPIHVYPKGFAVGIFCEKISRIRCVNR